MGHHPAHLAASNIPGSGSTSTLTWIVLLILAIAFGYLIYWLFSKDKKKW